MSKIVLLESLGISEEELNQRIQPVRDAGHEFVVFDKTGNESILKEELKDADIAMLANMPLSNEVIRSAEKLKWIDVAFTGIDHIGKEAVREKGIEVSNASGYSNEAVSEIVFGMVLSILRNMRQVEDAARQGKTKDGLVGTELKGKTIGIIGLGNIGTRSAELFHAFGCNVLAHSRTVHENAPAYVSQVSLEDLLAESDIVVLHCPLNESTRGMIDAEALRQMKNSAILINVARGPVVNTMDLVHALNDGEIAYAGVDVFDQEPPLSLDEPLLHVKNCLVTPHVAFATKESMTLRASIVFDNLQSYLEGNVKNKVM